MWLVDSAGFVVFVIFSRAPAAKAWLAFAKIGREISCGNSNTTTSTTTATTTRVCCRAAAAAAATVVVVAYR